MSINTATFKTRALFVATLLPFSAALSGCDGQSIEVVRTAQSPNPITIERDVPVYQTECHTTNVYGPHPSCGSYVHCTSHWGDVATENATGATADHYHPNHPGHPHHGGSHVNPNHHTHCTTLYHSCNHPVTQCSDYLAYKTKAKLNIRFDESAKLLPGEQETIALRVSGLRATKYVDVKIKNARYVYEYAKSFSVQAVGPEVEYTLPVRVNSAVQIKPENNLEVTSARYKDNDTLEVRLQDPFVGVSAISQSVYRIRVSRGLREYVDAEVRSGDVAVEGDSLVLTVRRGDAAWTRGPESAGGNSFNLSYWVERVSPLFNDSRSDKKSLTFKR